MTQRLTRVLPALLLILAVGCEAQGPVRHSPVMKLHGPFARNARRADILGFSPGASMSALGTEGDALRALEQPSSRTQRQDLSREAADLDRMEIDPTDRLATDIDWFKGYVGAYAADIDDQTSASVIESGDGSTYVDPAHNARLRYVVVDDRVKFYNEQGRQFEEGSNFYLSDRSVARLWSHVVITAEPELSIVENALPDSEASTILRFQELALSARLGPAELTVGRQPLWWGPGRHGSLLLTNNARPFDLVKVSTAGPVTLPWYFAYLGLLRGEVFATQLENARAVPHPYLAGMRLSSRVFPWLEIGGSRTAQFGGKGRDVDADLIWDVITGEGENDSDDPGNQLASVDMRIIVPWKTQPFEIYGEIGGEDEAGGVFSREAYLAGMHLPRVASLDWLEFTFEFYDNVVDGHPRTWYTNRNYPDGYTYHGTVIGHHVGTDGRDYFLELRLRPPILDDRKVSLALSYDYEEHFILDPVTERLHQFRAQLDLQVWQQASASVFVQHDVWENFAQRRGQGETGTAVGVGASWDF